MSDIAEALVRIRPNMSGFQPEVESGVRSAFGSIAKIAGIAFGAEQAFKFGESIVQHAADVQKQVEAIKETFQGASKAVLDFNEKSATALGISAHVADTTAAKFGILFQQLGIGPKLAATMTVNLEKLAGSISQIRNIDPATALGGLTFAIQGNLRSLKELGLSTNAAQLQVAAFKLGLTSTIKQALTPGQRALAVYAIATSHLSEFQAQAAKHAGDLATRARILSAEWDNAKDRLGQGLIPVLLPLVNILATKLPAAVDLAARAIADFKQTISGIIDVVKPAFAPIVGEIKRITDALGKGGIHAAVEQIRKDFSSLSPTAKGVVIALGGVAAALIAVTAAAFPISASLLAIAGIGVGLSAAYNHSAKFKSAVDGLHASLVDRFVPALKRLGAEAAPAFAQLATSGKKVWDDLITIFEQGTKAAAWIWTHFGSTISTVLGNAFGGAIRTITDALKIIEGIFNTVADVLTGRWGKAWKDIKDTASATLDALLVPFETWGKSLAAIWTGIWDNVKLIAYQGLEDLLGALSKIPTSFNTHIPGIGKVGFKNPFQGWRDSVQATIDGIKSDRSAKEIADAVASNTAKALSARTRDPLIAGAGEDLAKSTKKTISDKMKGAGKGSGDGFNAGLDQGVQNAKAGLRNMQTELGQAITDSARNIADSVAKAKQNLVSIGQTLATDLGTVIDEPFRVANEKINAEQDKIAFYFDKKNAELDRQSRIFDRLQAKIGLRSDKLSLENLRTQVLLPGARSLSTDPTKALEQLQKLANSTSERNRPAIEQFIQDYQSAKLTVDQDKLGLRKSALDAQRQAKETVLNLRSERLRVMQDAATFAKELAQRTIADMVVGLNTGKIGRVEFTDRLVKILTDNHASFKNAGKLLGYAFQTGFEEQAKGIIAQATALLAGPQRAGSGEAPTIEHPLYVMQKDTAKIERLQREIGNKQLALQKRIAKATEKAAAIADAEKSVTLGPTSRAIKGNGSARAKDLSGAGN